MRAALIAIPHPGDEPLPAVAGKSIAHRQLLFAVEAGCEIVVAFGNGASRDGVDLRHAAERFGLKFQVVSSAHALPGIIRDDDSMLVLQPGLLPESRTALDLLHANGDRILVVSAGPGARAGLERIDLDRAWAGSLTLPGRLLAKLASLPEDIAPHSALLRVALQERVQEARLADSKLDDGTWTLIPTAEIAAKRAAIWQRTQLGTVSAGSVSRWLGRALVTGPGRHFADLPYIRPAMLALAALLLAGGIASGLYDRPVAAFALAALSVPVLEAFLALSKLGVAPFGKLKRWPLVRLAVDLTLLILGVLAIDSLAHRSIFPPGMLAIGLLLLDRGVPKWLEPLRDRSVIAAFVAIIAGITTPELAIMLAALLVLFGNIIARRR